MPLDFYLSLSLCLSRRCRHTNLVSFVIVPSSLVCWELAGLLSSKCRGRSRKIINMHNGRVSVEVGRGKSLICITVESMTSSIVIT